MPYLGELSALLTAVLWSGTSLAFSSAAIKIGPLQLNINRMILASIFLFATIFILNFSLNISSNQIIYLSISGIIGLVFGDSFLFKAYQLIGARISMLLMALSPAMSAFLAYIFLDESLTFWGIIGMIVTILGIAFVVLERNEQLDKKFSIKKTGIFYGILGALGQAAGLIFAKLAFQESEVDKMSATFIRLISSVALMLPAAIIIRRYRNPITLYKNNLKALGATLIGTILGPYLGITFSLVAIDNTKVGIAATLMSTMPIIMLPMVKYIYKETLSWRSITGAFIAVAGVAILFLR
ncbi:MAG: DMT family transporter [Ignavibacteriaceae bacterium]